MAFSLLKFFKQFHILFFEGLLSRWLNNSPKVPLISLVLYLYSHGRFSGLQLIRASHDRRLSGLHLIRASHGGRLSALPSSLSVMV